VADVDASKDLEKAILERGQSLASEHVHQGEHNRAEILKVSAEKLRLLEEKEILLAKSHAERDYRREVRASEIGMQATLDRLRWALVSQVIDKVRTELAELAKDEGRYRPILSGLLASAAAAIEGDDLIASLNDADRRRFGDSWKEIAAAAAPDKTIVLASEGRDCSGGVMVATKDGRVRIDNTFEARLERLEPALCRVIVERLFPSPVQMETLFDG